MINGFRLRRVFRTHPACFASKFLFIRVICVIRDFNFGSRVKRTPRGEPGEAGKMWNEIPAGYLPYGGTISKGMAGRVPRGIRWFLFAFGLAAPGSTGRGA